jgi:glycosyltransferase involved in cell wall biosynthesis
MVAVSVCMPVYNRAIYIKECIDSILCQTFHDFELIIVDDGSTDETCEIIASYQDSRIKLYKNRHNFIESSNMTLSKASGKYIARMDSDDIMVPERLALQFEYMEDHPEVDVLGGGSTFIGDVEDSVTNIYVENVTETDLLRGCCISNPTTMIRRSSLVSHKLCYSDKSIYAEDYLLWVQCCMCGLTLRNIPTVLVRYRLSNSQVSSEHFFVQQNGAKYAKALLSQWIARNEELWSKSHQQDVPETTNQLSVIIPFLNEKEEVGNTVRSIRKYAGNKIDIIVINDQSNDKYNYRKDLKGLHVSYFYNSERKGVAASRDYGVSLCKTPYFILMDAHMRVYDDLWITRIVKALKEDERCVLCCQTKVLRKDSENNVITDNSVTKTFGAELRDEDMATPPYIAWKCCEKRPDSLSEEIPFVLGAGYAMSKNYWNYLKGLNGLKSYGSDEVYLSIKVWREGGKCILLKDVVMGHIYRDVSPFSHYTEDEIYNWLFISYLLMPRYMYTHIVAAYMAHNPLACTYALQLLEGDKPRIEKLKKYYNKILKKDFGTILRQNKYLSMEAKEQINKALSLAKGVYHFTLNSRVQQIGLYNGEAGIVLWLYYYADFVSDNTIKISAEQRLKTMLSNTTNDIMDVSFQSGLTGIGWMLLHLFLKGDIQNSYLKHIAMIDDVLMYHDWDAEEEYSFDSGIGGTFAYAVLRMQYGEIHSIRHLLKNLDAIALKILGQSSDALTIYYILSYLRLRRSKAEDFPCKRNGMEWFRAHLYIQKKESFWNQSLQEGTLGTILHAMILKTKYYEQD